VLAAAAVMGETVPPSIAIADRRLDHQRVGRRHVHSAG